MVNAKFLSIHVAYHATGMLSVSQNTEAILSTQICTHFQENRCIMIILFPLKFSLSVHAKIYKTCIRLVLDLHSLLLHDEGDYANRIPSYSTIPFANSEAFEVTCSQPFKGVQLN